MWQDRIGTRAGEGSAARRAVASGFVLSGTGEPTRGRVPTPAGR